MKKTDAELIEKIKKIFLRYLEDQKSTRPLHEVKNLPMEIGGALADLIYINKVENDTLVSFISELAYGNRNRYSEEDEKATIARLETIYAVLCSFDTKGIQDE